MRFLAVMCGRPFVPRSTKLRLGKDPAMRATVAALLGLVLALPLGAGAAPVEGKVMQELVPTGTLRVGVATAPAPTPVFAVQGTSGDTKGVPRDLGIALAKALGVAVEIVTAPTTGELTDALTAGTLDVAFMPADDERR